MDYIHHRNTVTVEPHIRLICFVAGARLLASSYVSTPALAACPRLASKAVYAVLPVLPVYTVKSWYY